MRSGERLALAVVLGLGILVSGTAGATAYAWHRAGNVRIAIHQTCPGGTDLSLRLPALLVNAAIALCPLPSDAELHARLDAVAPVLRSISGRLASMPDAVLVDVKDEGGTLRIEKLGADMLIHVASPRERVDVSVPVESLRRLVEKLETQASS